MNNEKKTDPSGAAQIVLRVPMEKKNAWVKASQKAGEKVSDWAVGHVEAALAVSSPPALDWSALPTRLRHNWIVITSVRSAAQVRHAQAWADTQAEKGTKGWGSAFDRAALEWLAENPMDPFWAAGQWPAKADHYLGNEATEEALLLLGLEA